MQKRFVGTCESGECSPYTTLLSAILCTFESPGTALLDVSVAATLLSLAHRNSKGPPGPPLFPGAWIPNTRTLRLQR